MADILIRGMRKMPRFCRECIFAGFGGIRNELNVCMLSGESQSVLIHERMSECPLIQLPEGHGRLIDADALRKAMYHEAFETDSPMNKWESGCWIRYKMFERNLEIVPTIVPPEGGRT